MALNAGTVWEIRTDGSQNNGGGFYNRNPGTSVDYSQQAAAQLTLTDLATDGAGTGLSSATGGFTAAMVGNIIRISGGTLTAGWYEITAYADTNNVTIDRSAGLSKTGGTGNVGGAFKIGGSLDNDFFQALVGGNTVYVKAGSYTLGENTTIANSASATLNISVIGYNSTRTDAPTGTDRPLIDCGTYYLTTGTYSRIENLRFTGTGTYVVYAVGSRSRYYNLKIENTSATAGCYGMCVGTSGDQIVVACEGVSTNGNAFAALIASNAFLACYAHDSDRGFYLLAGNNSVLNSVADTCTTAGVALSGAQFGMICGNTIYGCGTGVYSGTSYSTRIVNNIISGNTTGINLVANYPATFLVDYNCMNNTTDYAGYATAGPHDIDADPLLNAPATGDFTLASGSPCFAAGIGVGPIVGL